MRGDKRIKGGGHAGIFARIMMARLFDGSDEATAVRLRGIFGGGRWLLSWEPHEDGSWLARLSIPGRSGTVVRHGRTRVEAIERATRTMRQAMDFKLQRGQIPGSQGFKVGS